MRSLYRFMIKNLGVHGKLTTKAIDSMNQVPYTLGKRYICK